MFESLTLFIKRAFEGDERTYFNMHKLPNWMLKEERQVIILRVEHSQELHFLRLLKSFLKCKKVIKWRCNRYFSLHIQYTSFLFSWIVQYCMFFVVRYEYHLVLTVDRFTFFFFLIGICLNQNIIKLNVCDTTFFKFYGYFIDSVYQLYFLNILTDKVLLCETFGPSIFNSGTYLMIVFKKINK